MFSISEIFQSTAFFLVQIWGSKIPAKLCEICFQPEYVQSTVWVWAVKVFDELTIKFNQFPPPPTIVFFKTMHIAFRIATLFLVFVAVAVYSIEARGGFGGFGGRGFGGGGRGFGGYRGYGRGYGGYGRGYGRRYGYGLGGFALGYGLGLGLGWGRKRI